MPTLTIFTATYNRRHLISRIYDSLKLQSNKDFEWLIIDDGSNDNTYKLFQQYKNQKQNFRIRYYYQKNKGLIRSLNRGIKLAKGKYLIKLDSDDYFIENCIESIIQWINEIKNDPTIYAVGGLRVLPNGNPLKGVWPLIPSHSYIDASDLERYKFKLDADMTEAWSLQVLRKYHFPVWEGEKFAPEQIVFHQIALDGYKIRWYAKPLTICEYQPEGLTLGANKLEKENPMGYAMMYNQMLNRKDLDFFCKTKIAMNHIALSIVGKHPRYIFQSNSILHTFWGLIPGLLLSIRRYNQFK